MILMPYVRDMARSSALVVYRARRRRGFTRWLGVAGLEPGGVWNDDTEVVG
ncbi:hypothetical protein BH24DEI1_BH24DEI1_03200 [soil metagenome]|nr:hypothetical protein [Deinococcota bacterium]